MAMPSAGQFLRSGDVALRRDVTFVERAFVFGDVLGSGADMFGFGSEVQSLANGWWYSIVS